MELFFKDGSQNTDTNFELMVLDLYATHWGIDSTRLNIFGTKGEDQRGVDILGEDKNGMRIGIQCKYFIKKDFTMQMILDHVAMAEEEIDFHTLELTRLIFVTNHKEQARIQSKVDKYNNDVRLVNQKFTVEIVWESNLRILLNQLTDVTDRWISNWPGQRERDGFSFINRKIEKLGSDFTASTNIPAELFSGILKPQLDRAQAERDRGSREQALITLDGAQDMVNLGTNHDRAQFYGLKCKIFLDLKKNDEALKALGSLKEYASTPQEFTTALVLEGYLAYANKDYTQVDAILKPALDQFSDSSEVWVLWVANRIQVNDTNFDVIWEQVPSSLTQSELRLALQKAAMMLQADRPLDAYQLMRVTIQNAIEKSRPIPYQVYNLVTISILEYVMKNSNFCLEQITPESRRLLSETLELIQPIDKTIDTFNSSLHYVSDVSAFISNAAVIFKFLGDEKTALELIDKGLLISPFDTTLTQNKLMTFNDSAQRKLFLSKCLTFIENFDEDGLIALLEHCVIDKDQNKFITINGILDSRSLTASQKDIQERISISFYSMSREQNDKAYTLIIHKLKATPNDLDLHLLLVSLYYQMGQIEEMKNALNEALAIHDQRSIDARQDRDTLRLARFLNNLPNDQEILGQQLENYAIAAELFRSMIKVIEPSYLLHCYLENLILAGSLEEANEVFKQLEQFDTKSKDWLRLRVNLAEMSGDSIYLIQLLETYDGLYELSGRLVLLYLTTLTELDQKVKIIAYLDKHPCFSEPTVEREVSAFRKIAGMQHQDFQNILKQLLLEPENFINHRNYLLSMLHGAPADLFKTPSKIIINSGFNRIDKNGNSNWYAIVDSDIYPYSIQGWPYITSTDSAFAHSHLGLTTGDIIVSDGVTYKIENIVSLAGYIRDRAQEFIKTTTASDKTLWMLDFDPKNIDGFFEQIQGLTNPKLKSNCEDFYNSPVCTIGILSHMLNRSLWSLVNGGDNEKQLLVGGMLREGNQNPFFGTKTRKRMQVVMDLTCLVLLERANVLEEALDVIDPIISKSTHYILINEAKGMFTSNPSVAEAILSRINNKDITVRTIYQNQHLPNQDYSDFFRQLSIHDYEVCSLANSADLLLLTDDLKLSKIASSMKIKTSWSGELLKYLLEKKSITEPQYQSVLLMRIYLNQVPNTYFYVDIVSLFKEASKISPTFNIFEGLIQEGIMNFDVRTRNDFIKNKIELLVRSVYLAETQECLEACYHQCRMFLRRLFYFDSSIAVIVADNVTHQLASFIQPETLHEWHKLVRQVTQRLNPLAEEIFIVLKP